MKKVNPLLVFTGLALVTLAALAGVTYDRWSPQASGPTTLLAEAQSNAPDKNGAADTTQQGSESSKPAAASANDAPASPDPGSKDPQTAKSEADNAKTDNNLANQPAAQKTAEQEIPKTSPETADNPPTSNTTDKSASATVVAGKDQSAATAEAAKGAGEPAAKTGESTQAQTDSPADKAGSQQPAAENSADQSQDQAAAGKQAAVPADDGQGAEPKTEDGASKEAAADSSQDAQKTAPSQTEPPATDNAPSMQVAEAPATDEDSAGNPAKPSASAATGSESGKTDQDASKNNPPAGGLADQKPSFDTVRVEKTGDAVAAGEAAPNSEVTLLLDGQPIGKTNANADGSWVIIPDKPLAPGAGALSVRQKTAGDNKLSESEQTVAVLVPPKADKPPMVALVDPNQPVRIIQTPQQEKPATIQGKVALDSIDYNDDGDILFSGRADAGAAVRLYIDNHVKGDAVADASGRWSFTGREDVAAGTHALRVDRIDLGGKVVSRIELPFVREEASKVAAIVSAPEVAAGKTGPSAAPKQDAGSASQAAKTAAAESQQTSGDAGGAQTQAKSGGDATVPTVKSDQPPAAVEQETPANSAADTGVSPPPPPRAEQELAANTPEVTTPSGNSVAVDKNSAESEIAAATPAASPETPREGHIVIQPGNNLWKLSRVIYGRGTQYTVIYEANKDQIRNPGRIYPGQIFTTPNATPPDKIDPKRKKPLSPDEGGVTPP